MKISILTTGGTIEKTYVEHEGILTNRNSRLDEILKQLRLPDVFIRHQGIMQKDSLDMTEADRELILKAVQDAQPISDAVIILHGTDTLAVTGDYLYSKLENLNIPVILTGAMRPYEFRDSDALQNVTEAVLASRLLDPGVWTVMHSRVLAFPGVKKDKIALTFVKED